MKVKSCAQSHLRLCQTFTPWMDFINTICVDQDHLRSTPSPNFYALKSSTKLNEIHPAHKAFKSLAYSLNGACAVQNMIMKSTPGLRRAYPNYVIQNYLAVSLLG